MRSRLSNDEIASFHANGFIRLEGVLDADELLHWRTAVDAGIARHGTRRMAANRPDRMIGDAYFQEVFIQKQNFWQAYDDLRPLMLDATLAGLAARLAGIDGVRMWMDQALVKQPAANPTHWHLDAPFHGFTARNSIALWLALDDTTLENGCLYFLPGSHKTARLESNKFSGNMGDIFTLYPEWRSIEPVPVTLKAGDCTFHDELVAHAAGPNMTTRSRRGVSIIYMPDGATWNGLQACLTKEQAESLRVGDVLDDPRQNPLLYSTAKPRDPDVAPDFARYHSSTRPPG